MADGTTVGIGGWLATSSTTWWFAQQWDIQELRTAWPFLTKDAQKYIACFETVAQWVLLQMAYEATGCSSLRFVCTSKGLNVTENFPLSANPTDGNVAVRVENTAPTGFAMLEMSANGGAGFVRLETPSAGGCTLYAPNQEIWLQNRTSGSAPLVVETDSDVTVNYGFNNLSDERVKTNIADADLEALQAIFDGAHPKTYDRTDIEHYNRLGFLAQDFLGAGVTGKTYRDGEELLTLDYSSVASRSDNSPTQASINKLFTTAFPLSFFLEKVASWAHACGLELEIGHIPGGKNTDADDLSRNRLEKFSRSGHARRFEVHLSHLHKSTHEVTLASAEVPWSQGLLDIASPAQA